jgi:hypothetical protein
MRLQGHEEAAAVDLISLTNGRGHRLHPCLLLLTCLMHLLLLLAGH